MRIKTIFIISINGLIWHGLIPIEGIKSHKWKYNFKLFYFLDLKLCKSYNVDQEKVRDTLTTCYLR